MRERLLQAAMELMKRKGLKFTISDLAAELGTSKRTIYEHFESKEHIVGTLVDEAVSEVKRIEQGIYRDEGLSCAKKLSAILTILPKGLQLGDHRLLSDLKRFAPDEWLKVDRLLQEEWGTVRAIIEEGVAAGHFRPVHVPTIIQLMKGASVSLFDADFLMNTDCTLAGAVRTMADVFVQGLIPEGPGQEME
ncbi:TetR/AcrR family transcriptional regulator [Paenibacillus tyrfis]|uniref:TetR/AcrR family transcriptional regulator n=1 Tax=Paenibacillus tyrfis TaxID=1501230 RepID=UPI0020A216B3|nr:TetR/AcrR family transcriptional regulator [Paenibacillus tyrfis]MCP1311287.1 TetR/AcrR family transcriptional regulator [Paenibacillus tyrfis]